MTLSTELFALLDGIGGMEMMVIFALSLMLFGGKKLPEVARGLGKAVREFKRAASGVETEIRRAIDLESPPPTSSRPKAPVAPPRKHPPITDPAQTPEPQPASNTVPHDTSEADQPDLAAEAETESVPKKPASDA